MTKYKLENGMRQCSSCGNVYPDTGGYFYKSLCKTNTQCIECCKNKNKKWYENNKEKHKELTYTWRLKNPERRKEIDRKTHNKRYVNIREYEIRKSNEWRTNNPEKYRRIQRKSQINRRAKKNSLPNTLTESEIEFALEYFNRKCAYCGTKVENGYHLDHFIPLKSETCPGTIAQNILPVCAHCNHAKHANDPQIWLQKTFGKNSENILIEIRKYFSIIEKLKIKN